MYHTMARHLVRFAKIACLLIVGCVLWLWQVLGSFVGTVFLFAFLCSALLLVLLVVLRVSLSSRWLTAAIVFVFMASVSGLGGVLLAPTVTSLAMGPLSITALVPVLFVFSLEVLLVLALCYVLHSAGSTNAASQVIERLPLQEQTSSALSASNPMQKEFIVAAVAAFANLKESYLFLLQHRDLLFPDQRFPPILKYFMYALSPGDGAVLCDNDRAPEEIVCCNPFIYLKEVDSEASVVECIISCFKRYEFSEHVNGLMGITLSLDDLAEKINNLSVNASLEQEAVLRRGYAKCMAAAQRFIHLSMLLDTIKKQMPAASSAKEEINKAANLCKKFCHKVDELKEVMEASAPRGVRRDRSLRGSIFSNPSALFPCIQSDHVPYVLADVPRESGGLMLEPSSRPCQSVSSIRGG